MAAGNVSWNEPSGYIDVGEYVYLPTLEYCILSMRTLGKGNCESLSSIEENYRLRQLLTPLKRNHRTFRKETRRCMRGIDHAQETIGISARCVESDLYSWSISHVAQHSEPKVCNELLMAGRALMCETSHLNISHLKPSLRSTNGT